MSLSPQISNENNWDLLFSGDWQRALGSLNRKIPIGTITVPIQSESHLLSVFPHSQTSPDSYYLGGYISFWVPTGITVGGSNDARIGNSQPLQLGKMNLITVPKVSSSFEIRIAVPPYIDQWSVSIYEYIGLGEPTIEGKLEAIYQQILQE